MTQPHILAIDDTPANLMTLGAALADEFDLQFAVSGSEGLELAAASPPDLILLDVMMPAMDGFEVCRRLKADERLKGVPVMFLTALGETEAESAGLALGAADYLTKPFNVAIARQRIRNLLDRERLRKEIEAERNLLEQRVVERTAELEAIAGARARALEAAEKLSALKTQFMNNVSHELRTPLNKIIGMAQLAMMTDDLGKAKGQVRRVLDAGKELLAMVESVLDLSAVQAGTLQVRRERFDLMPIVGRASEKWRVLAAEKGLSFTAVTPTPLTPWVVGDSMRLEQVLDALLSNAVKFTERGSVTLMIAGSDDGCVFTVTDSGIGMRQEDLDACFKPFEQADGSSTRRFGGLGLGLALARYLTESMGGTLKGESSPGAGAKFSVTLPGSADSMGDDPIHADG